MTSHAHSDAGSGIVHCPGGKKHATVPCQIFVELWLHMILLSLQNHCHVQQIVDKELLMQISGMLLATTVMHSCRSPASPAQLVRVCARHVKGCCSACLSEQTCMQTDS